MFLKRGGMKQTFFCQLDDWLEEKRREAEARYTPDFLPPYNDFIYRDEAGEWVMTIPSRERARAHPIHSEIRKVWCSSLKRKIAKGFLMGSIPLKMKTLASSKLKPSSK